MRREETRILGYAEIARVLDETCVGEKEPAGTRVECGRFAGEKGARGEVLGEECVVEEEVGEGFEVHGRFIPHEVEIRSLGDDNSAANDLLTVQRPDVPLAAGKPEVPVDVAQFTDAELTEEVTWDRFAGLESGHAENKDWRVGNGRGAPGVWAASRKCGGREWWLQVWLVLYC